MRARAVLAATLSATVGLLVLAVGVGSSLYVYHRDARHSMSQAASGPGNGAFVRAARTIRGIHGPYVGAVTSNLRSFDEATGTRVNLTIRYLAWGSPSPAKYIEQSAQQGAQVLIVVLPATISLRQIVAGRGDAYLRMLARAIRGTRDRVLLSFGPEMNGRWYPWGYGNVSARLFVRAWRHVHDVMNKVASGDITWVWQISYLSDARIGALRPRWPGAKYVSIVGIDGYYYFRDSTFGNTFGRTLGALRTFTRKPVLVTETAVGQIAGQARKIPGLFAGIRAHHLLGLVWFDHNQNGGIFKQRWRLEGHRAALRRFRAGLRSLGARVR